MNKKILKERMRKMKNQKGITLVALIITIVVLLILAAVAIGTVKNSDIIGYAQNAATRYNQAKNNEITLLGQYENIIKQNTPSEKEEVKNPYGEDWKYAWVYTGTTWEGPKVKSNGDTADITDQTPIVAKFYEQENSPATILKDTYNSVTYELPESNTYKLAIEGKGNMGALFENNTPHAWHIDTFTAMQGGSTTTLVMPYVSEITICSGVTNIGDSAFAISANLKKVIVADTVMEIGTSAFDGCKSLESITLPDALIKIGGCAFQNCKSLESVTLPDELIEIGNEAFYGCTSLIEINIPENVTTIDNIAFSGCTNLTTITINKAEGSLDLSGTGLTEEQIAAVNWVG